MDREETLEQVSGLVEKVVFHDGESGFCVIRLSTKGESHLITVVGHTPDIDEGEYVNAEGRWVIDKRHGRQFSAERMRIALPGTVEGIERYLGSGAVKGIGPSLAKRLVKAFGTNVFEVIDREPRRLLDVEGIGESRRKSIVSAWAGQKVIREIMVFLQSYGVSVSRAFRIYKAYGKDAIDIVRDDPYRLARDIHGIGFKTADQIAERLGIEKTSMARAQAGINHVMDTLVGYGHCAFPVAKLVDRASELLQIPGQIIPRALEAEMEEGRLVSETIHGADYIYPAALFRAESEVARSVARLLQGASPLEYVSSRSAVQWVEKLTGLDLSGSQRTALSEAVERKVLVITGGPGVGKTTLVNCILSVFGSKGLTTLLCAPTGRAAKRLSEAAEAEARTIHRLLEFNPRTGEFQRDQRNPLSCDCVIVDECSMVDVMLMNHLVKAIPTEAILIMVGDADQLPSVGPGNVLADLLRSRVVPSVTLRGVFRQAAQSRIILNAHRINGGQMPLVEEKTHTDHDFYFAEADEPEEALSTIVEMVTTRIPDRFGFDAARDIQVLTPMNRTLLGAESLNARLQEALNPSGPAEIKRFGTVFRAGDKVMQIENDYDKNVFNGEIGFIHSIDREEQTVQVRFDGRAIDYDINELDELVLAYACTIHKSQGSEYPAVVIPVHGQHSIMLQRNLLYTGVTRAKKLMVLVGTRRALSAAVRKAYASRRHSFLSERLIHQVRGEGNLYFR